MEIRDMMSRIRFRLGRAVISALAVGVVSAVAGCGKEPASPEVAKSGGAAMNNAANTPAPIAAGTLNPEDLASVTKAAQPYKILLIVKTLNNPFFKPMVAAFKKTGAELGVQADVQAAPQETDVDKQAAL